MRWQARAGASSGFLIGAAALFLILDLLGVSGTVLWTAFTGFATVGAVAFFAAWSVLSNIFCTLLIFTTRPFRLNDTVELLENGEKPGIRGRVIDINLIYTTLVESGDLQNGSTVQIPNNLFFQHAAALARMRFTAARAPAVTTPTAPPSNRPRHDRSRARLTQNRRPLTTRSAGWAGTRRHAGEIATDAEWHIRDWASCSR